MLPDSSCLYFFLSCALSLFSLKTLTGQLSKNHLEPLRLLPPPQHLLRTPQPPVCSRYQFERDLLPPPTPVGLEEEFQTKNFLAIWPPLLCVAITATVRLLRASPGAQSVDRTPELPEINPELSFLAFYTLPCFSE